MSPDETTRLHFAYATSEPNLEAFDVKRVVPSHLLGEPAALTIIGESHYIAVPALDFHEVCSCKPLSGDSTAETPLEPGVEEEFEFENDLLRVETSAEVRAIEEFPGPESADAAFRFGPDAWTTIECGVSADVGDSLAAETDAAASVSAGSATSTGSVAPDSSASTNYETYHTYPEHGLAVYTLTKLHPACDAPASEATHRRLTTNSTDD